MTYVVKCEECGVVEFDALENNRFESDVKALWYAGYHDGENHTSSDYQMALPVMERDLE